MHHNKVSKERRKRLFTPLPRKQELTLMQADDEKFSRTRHYLDPMIMDALGHFELSATLRARLHRELLEDVPLAANRFLTNESSRKADYKFCTYFGWYIAQRINQIKGLRRIGE